MTNETAIRTLREQVEAGEFDAPPGSARSPYFDRFMGLAENALPQNINACAVLAWEAYNGSTDDAISLVKAVLPGWGYRICECYLSDDAAVYPDFNNPENGDQLRAELSQSFDWFNATDVDQRPAGNPARALFISTLKAMQLRSQLRTKSGE